MEGPFQGLRFLKHSAEGCHIPKLIGCYEQPLHDFIQKAVNRQYEIMINIGCAEGYYAVGMARLMPATHVHAYDSNPAAQKTCAELASINDVTDRITIGGLFDCKNFGSYEGKSVLIICDIEGAEIDLLDPAVSPSLKKMDIIVECHDCFKSEISKELSSRFQSSHQIAFVQDNGQRSIKDAPQWFLNLAHLDQLLATWEWRSGPTPWLVMIAN